MGKKEITPLRSRRQYPSSGRGSANQTRNQRKRERIKTALMVVVLLIALVLCMRLFLAGWVHPAEQHITGTAYAASILGESGTWE